MIMIKFNAFSRLKNFFSRFNPLNSFKWEGSNDENIEPPSSRNLLEGLIKKYPNMEYIILISIYHLMNTQNSNKEYLTVVNKDLRLVCDLVEGNELIVETPIQLESEGEKDNLLIATHNHFFGAIIPSLGDICNALNHKCKLISIVSDNNIGIIFIGYDGSCDEELINVFETFHGYLDICFNFERNDEL